jgi:glucosamine--fructose-6-phosphate aminotransferase (isomerizing)
VCGIIAIVRRRATRSVPSSTEVLSGLPALLASLPADAAALGHLADQYEALNAMLSGVPGVTCLMSDAALIANLTHHTDALEAGIAELELLLEAGVAGIELEGINASLLRLKDAGWAIGRDRLRTALAVADMCQEGITVGSVEAFTSVQEALSAIDRLEVRGRDSAGLHLLVRAYDLDLDSPDIQRQIAARGSDPLFGSGSVRIASGHLSFVYKAAAEIGELGDNTRALRAAITADDLLRRALVNDEASVTVLGHTRWASVGIISEPNAHPLNSELTDDASWPYVTAALNGDVDNFADIRSAEGLSIAPTISTDAKVIPTLMAKHLDAIDERSELSGVDESFRRTVAALEGSVAIAASTALTPNRLQLALRGSGQALYVGLAEDAFVVASEPYGVVELTNEYVRMDGETPGDLDNPTASRGQIISLDGTSAGDLGGIRRVAYDGTVLPVTSDDVVHAEITTRDIDRGAYPHFLLKEISEAPQSFRKTLRGKIIDEGDELAVRLAESSLPEIIREKLRSGTIRQVLVIGQGTAAVAGQSLALILWRELAGAIEVDALPATELSGFRLRSDMSDVLIIAISQSGTTTDTNRTVDLVRGRGASVISIVNRRNSDLTDKSDGVLYTSDGRDVEMSVASTKAFYAQIAAGAILALAIAAEVVPLDHEARGRRQRLLQTLRELPDAMERVIGQRDAIGRAATEFGPSRRYWAIVGNGPNVVAAREIRIKLSELCYKSIAADSTEDKKHIDLSCEPMILVCAAGLVGSTASDVAKEVAIYRAHKAAPIVIADDGADYPAALHVISVPSIDPALSFVLSTVAGHLFGYEAALSIDAQAQPLRETRAAVEQAVSERPQMTGEVMLGKLRPRIATQAQRFLETLRAGEYNGHLEASSAARIASLFRYAIGTIPLDSYQLDYGTVGTPAMVLEDLMSALTVGIDDLTRPIDAIKHQAKTVTVGISRSDEELIEIPFVKELLAAGTPRDRLSYQNLRTLASIDPAVSSVTGYIRYRIEGDAEDDGAQLVIVDRGGVARDMPSRVDREPSLRGSKRLVAVERQILLTRGRRDGRMVAIVPEVKDNQTVGITLLHLRLEESLEANVARGVLQGYRNRYAGLRDFVTETEPTFREDLLASVPVDDLLSLPITSLAEYWTA